jgi:hypothetical protein
MRTLVALGALAVATALLGRGFGLHDPRFLGSEVALLVSMFVISRYVLPLVERRDRGAQGEEHVGGVLNDLVSGNWHVLHDATLGHGNVDHIVLGPGGIFTIETKSHPGPIRVGRIHGATLQQAAAHAAALAQTTGLHAEPMIVYSRAWIDRPGARRKGVRVLPARMLVTHLHRRGAVLTAAEVARAYDLVADALLRQEAHRRPPHERWQLTL